MKIMQMQTTIKVDTFFEFYEREDNTYEYAIDTAPPMNNDLYEEWKAEVVRMITEDVKRKHYVETIERIYMEYTLQGKTYIEELA